MNICILNKIYKNYKNFVEVKIFFFESYHIYFLIQKVAFNKREKKRKRKGLMYNFLISTKLRTFLRSLSKASFRLNILRLSRMLAALLCDTVATRRLGFFVVDVGRFGERPFGV